jgi:hypothetical protein
MSTEKINLIYKESPSNQSVSYLTPILFILIVLSLFGYLYSNIQRKMMHIHLSEQKCNPRYLFFSGFLDPLNKNPWVTTQDNFQKCVSTNIYKDPALNRAIKTNQSRIKKHKDEMTQNLSIGDKYSKTVKKGWENLKETTQNEVTDVENEIPELFDKNTSLYEQILLKSSQMFHMFASIVRYLQGVLIYNASNSKTKLNIDENHDYFMSRYSLIYKDYTEAYDKLNENELRGAINSARDAIEKYNALNQELEDFMNAHYKDIQKITENCYHLKYNLDDPTCSVLFPKLNQQFVDFYPMIKQATNMKDV